MTNIGARGPEPIGSAMDARETYVVEDALGRNLEDNPGLVPILGRLSRFDAETIKQILSKYDEPEARQDLEEGSGRPWVD